MCGDLGFGGTLGLCGVCVCVLAVLVPVARGEPRVVIMGLLGLAGLVVLTGDRLRDMLVPDRSEPLVAELMSPSPLSCVGCSCNLVVLLRSKVLGGCTICNVTSSNLAMASVAFPWSPSASSE